MSKFKVLLTDRIHDKARAMLEEICELKVCPDSSFETLRSAVAGMDALIVRNLLPGDVFEQADRMRVVVRHGVGLDFIPVDMATKRGILVANVPGANSQSVVEHVVGLMFLMARKFHELNRRTHQGDWNIRHKVAAFELQGKTLGLVGLGKIGGRLALICQGALEMQVLGYDPHTSAFPRGIKQASLEEIFKKSQFISLHVPLTAETKSMVGERLLSLMQKDAFLINACRGPVVVEADLVKALRDGVIGGAALDVFNEEPLPEGHPFLGLENLVLTPHSAALTAESFVRMGTESAQEVLRALRGEKPVNLVNPEAWPAYVANYGI
jgi:D-3-phosphoglycerate dehydrogenase